MTARWLSSSSIMTRSTGICLMIALMVASTGKVTARGTRVSKSLGFLTDAYLDQAGLSEAAVDDGPNVGSDLSAFDDALQEALPDEDGDDLSRARPNSPIYYIRLPPEPYVLIPGLGYVSRPPMLRPPPVVQPRPEANLIHVPVKYVSNAKPIGVYSWKPEQNQQNNQYHQQQFPQQQQPQIQQQIQPPKPTDTPLTHLDKGPYVFNGKPTDLFLLRNTYNSLYEDALHNFYP